MKGIPSMMEEVFYNLCDNGIKYNKQDGRVSVTICPYDDMGIKKVSIKVEDTGIGIPMEDQERVFERFYRVDKARARESGGSGLGLAIVRSMVERNNGEITLQSTVGKGTTFTVSFPRFDIEEEDEA